LPDLVDARLGRQEATNSIEMRSETWGGVAPLTPSGAARSEDRHFTYCHYLAKSSSIRAFDSPHGSLRTREKPAADVHRRWPGGVAAWVVGPGVLRPIRFQKRALRMVKIVAQNIRANRLFFRRWMILPGADAMRFSFIQHDFRLIVLAKAGWNWEIGKLSLVHFAGATTVVGPPRRRDGTHAPHNEVARARNVFGGAWGFRWRCRYFKF